MRPGVILFIPRKYYSVTETLDQSLAPQAEAPRNLLWGRKTSWASPLLLFACLFLFCVLFACFGNLQLEEEAREVE